MKANKGVIYQRKNPQTIPGSENKKTPEKVGAQSVPIPPKDVGNKASKELETLAVSSSRIILDIKTVFPFDLFPDEIIVDESKVSVRINYFFYSKEVRSVEFKDIFNVIIQEGYVFAQLEIVDRFFSVQPLIIPYLWKKDAIKARRVIQGMIIATKQNIDIKTLPLEELIRKLDRIGQAR